VTARSPARGIGESEAVRGTVTGLAVEEAVGGVGTDGRKGPVPGLASPAMSRNAAAGASARVDRVVDEALVRRLLAEQFPHWSDLPLRRVVDGENDHGMFRLGDRLSVRVPSAPQAAFASYVLDELFAEA
jgi:hypothetical protein